MRKSRSVGPENRLLRNERILKSPPINIVDNLIIRGTNLILHEHNQFVWPVKFDLDSDDSLISTHSMSTTRNSYMGNSDILFAHQTFTSIRILNFFYPTIKLIVSVSCRMTVSIP